MTNHSGLKERVIEKYGSIRRFVIRHGLKYSSVHAALNRTQVIYGNLILKKVERLLELPNTDEGVISEEDRRNLLALARKFGGVNVVCQELDLDYYKYYNIIRGLTKYKNETFNKAIELYESLQAKQVRT